MKLTDNYVDDIESGIDARPAANDTRSHDEARRFLEDMRGAIEPLERELTHNALVCPARPDVERARHDFASRISNWQSSQPLPPSSKGTLLSMMVTTGIVVVGVAIGYVFIPANTVRLVWTGFPVSHSSVELAGTGSDSVSEDLAPTAMPLVQPVASSPPIASAAELRASVDRVPVPAQMQVTPSSAAQSAEPAQPAATPAETVTANTLEERNQPSLQIESIDSVQVQSKVSSLVSDSQDESSKLFREFLEWQSNKAKTQVQQERLVHSPRRIAGPKTLRSHHSVTPNAPNKRTSS